MNSRNSDRKELNAMEFLCDSKYLVFPASHYAQNKRIFFYIDDKLVYDFVMALDYDDPDYEFHLNVDRFKGKNIRVECGCDMDIKIIKSDIKNDGYEGKYRPYAHYTAKRGWLNDPNGLMCYNGKYLMFYQHNPVACTWENMHWGYAVSDDLIHWQEKEIALFADEDGTMFSGSAIIDRKNVTRLKENDNDVILLFYTCAGSTSEASKGKPFTQNLAYSTDGGETFVKYAKNPLIGQIVGGNRDPKVIYYEPDDSYIMVLFLEEHEFVIFKSKNLLNWTEIQRLTLSEDAECPDFYSLVVDGNNDNTKWVFTAASDRYYIGSFDGEKFTPETELKRFNYGNNSYAAQSWSDIPDRRIRTAFATVVIPGHPFGSVMNIPQEMSLKTVNGEICLCAEPVKEIEKLYLGTSAFDNITADSEDPFRCEVNSKCCDIYLKIKCGSLFKLSLFGLSIGYDAQSSTLKCLDKNATVKGMNGTIDLRIVIDTVYAEIFADSGSVFMGMTYIQDSNLNKLIIKSDNAIIESLTISEMEKFFADYNL